MLIFLFHLASASHVVKNFSTLILPRNSSQLFPLLDYFSGNNLTYSVSDVEEKSHFKILQSPRTLDVTHHLSPLLKSLPTIKSYKMQVINVGNEAMTCYFTSSTVIILQTNLNNGDSELNSIIKVPLVPSDFNITSILPIPSNFEMMSVLVVGTGIDKNEIVYQFFLIVLPFADKALATVNKISLPELVNVTRILMGNGSVNGLFALTGVVEDLETIFILKMGFYKANLVQSIQNISFGNIVINIEPILVNVETSTQGVLMFVLDAKSYLFVFKLNDGYFEINQVFNLKKYGELLMMEYNQFAGEFQNTVFVSTSSGIVAADFKLKEETLFYPSQNVNFTGIHASNYQLYLIFNATRMSLATVSFKYRESALQVLSLNYVEYTADAAWAIVQGTADVYLLRVDKKLLTVVKSRSIIPKLKISTTETPLSCNVTALNNESSSECALNVTILEDVYNPSLIYQGKPYNQALRAIFGLEEFIDDFSLPTWMVSGFNISCKVTDYLPKKNYYILEDISSKIVDQDFLLPRDQSAKYIVQGNYLIQIYSDQVLISELGKLLIIHLNISSVSKVLQSSFGTNSIIFLCFTSKPKNYLKYYVFPDGLSSNPMNNSMLLPQINPEKSAIFMKYLAIGSSYSILIYKLSFSSWFFQYELIFSNNRTDPILSMSMTQDPSISSPYVLYVGHRDYVSIFFESEVTGNKAQTNYYFGSVFFHQQMIAQGSNIFLLTENTIMIYRTLFHDLLQVKSIEANGFYVLDDFILCFSNNKFLLVNSSENFLSQSVFYGEDLGNREVLGFTYNSENQTRIILQDQKNIIILKSLCPSSSCSKEVKFKFNLTNDDYVVNKRVPLNIIVECFGLSKILSLNYSVEIKLLQNLISIKKELPEITNSYLHGQVIYISDYFLGYNLNANLSLESKYLKNKKNSPIYIQESLQLLNTVEENKEMEKITDFTIVRHLKTALVATRNGQMYYVHDFFNNHSFFHYPLPLGFENVCPIVRNYGSKDNYNLIVLGCSTLDNKYKIFAAIVDVQAQKLIKLASSYLTYKFQDLRILQGSTKEFAVAVIELTGDLLPGNNHIEIFYIQWNSTTVEVMFLTAINLFTVDLSRLLIKAIDGVLGQDQVIELYIADYYSGLRIFHYGLNEKKLKLVDSFIVNRPLALGICDRVLFVASKDSSVVAYRKTNGKFLYFKRFPEYQSEDMIENYGGGIVTCNTYYEPRYFIISFQTSNSTLIRIYDLLAEYYNAIIKDIKISESGFNSGGLFFNDSVILVYEALNGKIFVLSINELSLTIPKLSFEEYQEIESTWGKGPYNFTLNISNEIDFVATSLIMTDTGKLSIDSSNDSIKISWYYILGIVIIVLIGVSVITPLAYCIILRKRKLNASQQQAMKINVTRINRISMDHSKIDIVFRTNS